MDKWTAKEKGASELGMVNNHSTQIFQHFLEGGKWAKFVLMGSFSTFFGRHLKGHQPNSKSLASELG